jgi:hypothetical protein
MTVLRKRCEETGSIYREIENSDTEFFLQYEVAIENLNFNISFEPNRAFDGILLTVRNGISKTDIKNLEFAHLNSEYLEDSIARLLQHLSY